LKWTACLLLCLLCIWPARGSAADDTPWHDRLTLWGWIEGVRSMRVKPPRDALTSRIGARLKLSAELGRWYGFVSVDAEKNWEIAGESGINLHEGWLEHAGDGWDLRIGRQIIIWGKADGVQITDIVSPPDYTEAITRELDEIRLPVDAVRFRLLGEKVDAELIWIPVFKAAIQPTGDNPWAISRSLPENVSAASRSTDEPGTSLENSEIAFKIASYLSGLDLAASVFYTWDDYPAAHRTVRSENDRLQVTFAPKHHRLTVFGLECSRPWSDFVFRGEAAYYLGRYYATDSLTDDPVPKDTLKWLGGVDWTPGNDWTVTAQLTGTLILDHEDRLAERAHDLLATLNLSKKLLRQTLTLSSMLYYRLNDNEIYDRLKVEYALTDAFHLSVGADIFCGDDGPYGQYRDNTQVWLRGRYNF
jgi:hypothetical protein